MNNKVLLILVDGMRPDAVMQCDGGAMRDFFQAGTYSMTAQTVFPPITLPVHISLFHSVDPSRHQTMDNIYIKQNHPVESLLDRIGASKKTSATFYSWFPLRDICTPNADLTYSYFINQHSVKYSIDAFCSMERRLTAAAMRTIHEDAPDFVFLYLGGTDEFGHQRGWMSKEYFRELQNAWSCIQSITADLPEEYHVIVTADHGGHDRCHGENIPADMTIPMTFHGNHFREKCEVDGLNIKDIAVTVTDLLGIAPGDEWEGVSRVNA